MAVNSDSCHVNIQRIFILEYVSYRYLQCFVIKDTQGCALRLQALSTLAKSFDFTKDIKFYKIVFPIVCPEVLLLVVTLCSKIGLKSLVEEVKRFYKVV